MAHAKIRVIILARQLAGKTLVEINAIAYATVIARMHAKMIVVRHVVVNALVHATVIANSHVMLCVEMRVEVVVSNYV